MTEMYGSYSDEDLNEWERMSQNIRVLTSSAFGSWLLRRDKRIKERETKTGRWIPVSERLPEEGGEYLVTYDGIATTLDYSDKCGWHYDDGEHFTQFGDDVIAWMPLPEPYKGK